MVKNHGADTAIAGAILVHGQEDGVWSMTMSGYSYSEFSSQTKLIIRWVN